MTTLNTITPFNIYKQIQELHSYTSLLIAEPSTKQLQGTIAVFLQFQTLIKQMPYDFFEPAIFNLAKKIKLLQNAQKYPQDKPNIPNILTDINKAVEAIFTVYKSHVKTATPSQPTYQKLNDLFLQRNESGNAYKKLQKHIEMHGVDPDISLRSGITMLQHAILHFDAIAVEFLIRMGAGVNYSPNNPGNGNSFFPPLILACKLYAEKNSDPMARFASVRNRSLDLANLADNRDPLFNLEKTIPMLLRSELNMEMDSPNMRFLANENLDKTLFIDIIKVLKEFSPNRLFLGDLLRDAKLNGNEDRVKILLDLHAPIFPDIIAALTREVLLYKTSKQEQLAKQWKQLYKEQTSGIRTQLVQARALLSFPYDLIEMIIGYVPCASAAKNTTGSIVE